MSNQTGHWGLIGLLFAAASAPATAATVSSDFSVGRDDWTVVTFGDNGQPDFTTFVSSGGVPEAVAAGGDPGGFIRTADPDSGWTYFAAPVKYRGDQIDKFGGTLSFSLQHALNGGSLIGNPPHVVLKSGGLILVADAGDPPALTPAWARYNVSLTSGSWRIGTLNGALAGDDDIQQMLGNLDGLFLAGEFVTPVVETNGLDSVNFAPVPLPAAVWGMLGALGALGLRGRRHAGQA
jgi:hypothetical protein